MEIPISNSSNFMKAFTSLTEAKNSLQLIEEKIRTGAITPDQKMTEEIAKMKVSISAMMDLLLSNQADGGDVEEIQSKTISILSTTTAYYKVLKALLDVQEKLKEQEKESRDKAREIRETNELLAKADELRQKIKTLIEIKTIKENNVTYEDKLKTEEVENLKQYLKAQFGFELKINDTFDKIV